MNTSRPTQAIQQLTRCALAVLAAATLQGTANAQEGDLAEGAKLYVSQCKICHGSVSAADQAQAAPVPPRWQLARLAMQHGAQPVRTDSPMPLVADLGAASSTADLLAFAPPFGPHLRGVYGRPAGTVEEFQYSITFLKTLKGMEWNDAALDVWITNPQAWVPGVYMFYKQPDREIRRKIIEYLKASQ
jgi:cytochrome c2